MRVAVAQINTTLGDFEGNRKKILDYTKDALSRKCDLVVFPESTVFGYHPFDLLERKNLVERQIKEIETIHKKIPLGIGVFVGGISINKAKNGRPYFNSVYFLEKGKKAKIFHKELLPTGDVFDEGRFIENGSMKKNLLLFKGKKVLVTICEDIWAWQNNNTRNLYIKNPILQFKGKKIDLVINLSASPYFPGKFKLREDLVRKTVKLLKAPMIYVNLVGAQDEIVFDGQSFAVDKKGKICLKCLAFEEDLNLFDTFKNEGGNRSQKLTKQEELRQALVLGLRDYCKKNRIQRVHLGLSGGVDSALVACLAVDALGPSKVTGWGLPGPFSSPDSLKLAEELAKNLGIHFKSYSIDPLYSLLKRDVAAIIKKEPKSESVTLVEENIQSRIRGVWLMAESNFSDSLLLATSNKSEIATGYSTLYGDMCGGLMLIGDLLKKEVYELSLHYNKDRKVIPEKILTRPPTAELRPNQKDQDSLPSYDLLDRSVKSLVENQSSEKNKVDKWLFGKLLSTEFKRWQAPPIIKVSKHSFGRGRRWPISQSVNLKTK